MTSLKRRVTDQRNAVTHRSHAIRAYEDGLRTRLHSLGLELGNPEWRNGHITVPITLRVSLFLLLAGVGVLLVLRRDQC